MTGKQAAPPEQSAGRQRPIPLPLWGVVVVAALVVLVMGLRSIADIVAPMFLVMTLVITAQPLRRRLSGWRIPGWVSSLIVLVVIYLALAVVLGAVVWSALRLVDQLPRYYKAFDHLYTETIDVLHRAGVQTTDIKQLLSKIDIGSYTGVAQGILGRITSAFSLVGLMALTAVFLSFDAASGTERVAEIQRQHPRVAEAFDDFAVRVRRYWVVTTVFGLIVAGIDVVALWIIGVPLALTWGLLAFVTNYIPNLGFVLGLLPPALIAFLEGGPGSAIWVVVSYIVINFVIQTLIQPRFVGDAAGINASVAFISLIFWAAILGGLGALLAVPATLFVKVMLVDHADRGHWFGALINSRPGTGPPDESPEGRGQKRCDGAPSKSTEPEESAAESQPEDPPEAESRPSEPPAIT